MNALLERLAPTEVVDDLGRTGAPLPPGPWDGEPDKVVWIDAFTGLDCMIVRNAAGALCGYAAVPPGHPWHGVGYSDCTRPSCNKAYCWEHAPEALVEVHGGLTYAAVCDEGGVICHVAQPARPADVWWFGFDCAHAGDVTPGYGSILGLSGGRYRDVAYVAGEVEGLARQLVAVTVDA